MIGYSFFPHNYLITEINNMAQKNLMLANKKVTNINIGIENKDESTIQFAAMIITGRKRV